MPTLTEMVSAGKLVWFVRYENQNLWYQTDCGFEFPVPIEDTGTATFKSSDKALYFMRWIRKHRQLIDQAVGLHNDALSGQKYSGLTGKTDVEG